MRVLEVELVSVVKEALANPKILDEFKKIKELKQ